MNRIKWIDSVKGIAILSVVLCHVVAGIRKASMFVDSYDLLFSVENICDMFQMPLFTAASGYIFYSIYIKGQHSRKKQLINLLMLYVFWEVLFWSSKYLLSSYVNDQVGIRDLLFIPLNPLGPFWYLYLMMILYLLFGIKKIYSFRCSRVLTLLIVLGLIGGWIRSIDLLDFEYLFYLSFFYIGILLAKYEYRPNNIYYMILFVSTVIVIVFNWQLDRKIYYIPFVNYYVAFGLTLCILRAVEIIGCLKCVSYVGEHSIELYCLHSFIVSFIRIAVRRLDLDSVVFAIVLLFVSSVVLSLAFGRLIRKTKLYNLFFKPCNLIKKWVN